MSEHATNTATATDRPLWRPDAAAVEALAITRFTRQVEQEHGVCLPDYAALHAWSVREPEAFWSALWAFCEVQGSAGASVLEEGERMPGARWFPQARLNFAQNLLCRRGNHDALVAMDEEGRVRRMSWDELWCEVAALAAALHVLGVRPGDRVAALLPNRAESVIAMLASASIGAVFTSASPDFGVQGVLDRFGQTRPRVLFACDSYRYAGKIIDVLPRLETIAAGLPELERLVVVGGDDAAPRLPTDARAGSWSDFVSPYAGHGEIAFESLPFDHPLYIMYSSGTTGVPKCIVHGAGGTLLQHLKEHRLHCDVRPDDRVFFFSTCGWMMWNWLVSALGSGACVLLYDGSPMARDGRILFDLAEREGMTHFGTSAKFIDAIAKTGLSPRQTHDLSALRMMLSTGSPLVAESFDYVYREIKPALCLASISGGTDILSCFVLGNPALPVWRGEIQCKGLGMAVEIFSEAGRPVRGGRGELVCTRSFPCMPLGFWNDADGSRYRAAYFERFPGVWCHGDYCELTPHDGIVIHGRSDATLNPGGVRIGTAEIYRQVERLDEIVEAVAIGQAWPPGREDDVRVVLFVRLRDGCALDDALTSRIRRTLREQASPRHVPARIVEVADIPRTRSGKIAELAVRDVVHGREVRNVEALANPESLTCFADRAELRT